MKTTIINGSYHKEGMTSSLIDNLIKGLGKPKENIFLMDHDFRFCEGCASCLKKGTCGLEDEAARWIREAGNSDIVVLATPVYMFAPTAIMKKFLERNLSLFQGAPPRPRTQKVKGRTGVILLSSGAPYPINMLLRMTSYPVRIMRFILKGYGCSDIHVLRAGGMELSRRNFDRWNDKARGLGKMIQRSFRQKP